MNDGKFMPGEYNVYMVAEIGVNHNGDVKLAKELIDAAAESGADAVKFQTYETSRLVSRNTPKVAYQLKTSDPNETHYSMLKRLELSKESHHILFDYCTDRGIEFFSTPSHVEDARFLDELGVRLFKTASADLVDLPLHTHLASIGKPILVAVGMGTLGEIEETVSIYRLAGVMEHLILLHCVSNYPAALETANLRVIRSLRSAFGCRLGFSDHTEGTAGAIAAVALGARVIERHFTIDRDLPGPDHKASSTPEEFKEMVRDIRRVESGLGDGVKRVIDEEREMRDISRKSIVTRRDVVRGEILSQENLALKRPGTGIAPRYWKMLEGRRARRNLDSDLLMDWDYIE